MEIYFFVYKFKHSNTPVIFEGLGRIVPTERPYYHQPGPDPGSASAFCEISNGVAQKRVVQPSNRTHTLLLNSRTFDP